ncbi:hypothetical protein HYZ97_03310 [Candidatus Pacearchaeota archaeon]|nr:hypothetical protein [Candidatus Pacearchaeota archaeon]
MFILKLLGGIDLVSAIAFLMMVFGMSVPFQFILFCAGLLLLKGMFIITGDMLSIVDLVSSIFLLLSLVITLPAILLWAPAFLLLAKGLVSFI